VVILAARVVELQALDVDWPAGEDVVAAAVVEVQVGVDRYLFTSRLLRPGQARVLV
jgi:hypothetical protein